MKHLLIILCASLLYACNSSSNQKTKSERSGGTFSMALEQFPSHFKSAQVSDIYTSTVLSQVKEGLVSIDPKSLKIKPQIAATYQVSSDGLVYTFHLREDVLFHSSKLFTNEEERLLTAQDVVFSIEQSCQKTSEGASYAFQLIYKHALAGADAFHEGKSSKISGLQVVDEHTLSIRLNHKDPNFLYKLANIAAVINAKKLWNTPYYDKIGTGPFQFSEISEDEIRLIRNEDYYQADEKGCQLPYLDALHFYHINSKIEQLTKFENEELDIIVGLPSDAITKMLEGRINDFNGKDPLLVLKDNPLLFTNYYLFNMKDPRFQDVRVRQAFNYAIDKEKIGSKILKYQYNDLGYYGIVPPVKSILKGYDFNSIKKKGYNFNVKKAKELLSKAGYPNGKGFGTLNLRFSISDINSKVADEIATQLSNHLNINVNIDGSSFDQLEKDIVSNKVQFFRNAWSADYPSPETFLANFYSKNAFLDEETGSIINASRYSNPKFDDLFENAIRSSNKLTSYNYFVQAEIELLENPPFIPLWYSADFQVYYGKIKQLEFNALRMFSFKNVYKN